MYKSTATENRTQSSVLEIRPSHVGVLINRVIFQKPLVSLPVLPHEAKKDAYLVCKEAPSLQGILTIREMNESIFKNFKTLNNTELREETVHPEHLLKPLRAGKPVF